MAESASTNSLESAVTEFKQTFEALEGEVSRVIVGMRDVVRRTLSCIFAGGHVLLEGVPGLGKTPLVKSVAKSLGLSFKRMQFTPDLMPSDVTGTQILTEDERGRKSFTFKPGPIDRFLNKIHVPSPSSEELKEILRRTTGSNIPEVRAILPADQIGV